MINENDLKVGSLIVFKSDFLTHHSYMIVLETLKDGMWVWNPFVKYHESFYFIEYCTANWKSFEMY